MTTPKTLQQLLDSFPNNNIGSITPLNLRDFVCSVELKYDNWTVVKPGQPEGNKFPDPSGGEITLADNTVWVINGTVTLQDSLVCGNSVQIISLSGSFSFDELVLDVGAGAIPLIKNDTGNPSFNLIGLFLNAGGGSGRIFDIDDGSLLIIRDCAIGGGALGTIADVNSIRFENNIMLLSNSALNFSGSFTEMIFMSNIMPGTPLVNLSDIFNFVGTTSITTIVIDSNRMTNETTANFFVFTDDNDASTGIINNNIQVDTGGTGSLISGLTAADGINFTFSENSGFENTHVRGGLGMRSNGVTTINPGINTWTLILGTTTEADNSIRWQQSANMTLQYLGNETFKGTAILTGNARRGTSGDDDFEFALFQNAALIQSGGIDYVTKIELESSDLFQFALVVPIEAVTNDLIDARTRSTTTSSQDVTVEDLQLFIKEG